MKLILSIYVLAKLSLVALCLLVCLPLVYAFPAYFARGIDNFVYTVIDDMVGYGLLNEEQAEKWREDYRK